MLSQRKKKWNDLKMKIIIIIEAAKEKFNYYATIDNITQGRTAKNTGQWD
jgi:hypothetical protein